MEYFVSVVVFVSISSATRYWLVFALRKYLSNLININKTVLPPPGIINIGSYFSDLQLCEKRKSGHLMVKSFSIHNHFTCSTILNKANDLSKVIIHIVRA